MVTNVRDHGAFGDGISDDRAAIQAAIDLGGEVYFPDGTYRIGKGSGAWGLAQVVPAILRGESRDGVVLMLADGTPANTRLLHVVASGTEVRNLTLDGNKENHVANEHRHGIFATASTGVRIRDIVARNFTGDGVYVHIGSHDASIERVISCWNDRNGITFGGGTTGGAVRHCEVFGNAAQQIDSEPGPGTTTDDVTIEDCVITSGGDYALTVSGSGSAWQSRRWLVQRNVIHGAINVVWSADCLLRDNEISVFGEKQCVRVYRLCDDVRIMDNRMTATNAPSAVAIFGTPGQQGARIAVRGNQIACKTPMHGVHVISAHSVAVQDNRLRGPAMTSLYHSGVYARATVLGETIESVMVQRNDIADFGALGVTVTASPGGIGRVEVSGNAFDNRGAGGMLSAMAFDKGRDIRQHGNVLLGSCATMVGSTPAGNWQPWADGDRWMMP